jgi:DNA-binding response OmpR family regulator
MSPRVLVVDDDPQVLRLMRVNLEMEGYDVVSAPDGAEALDAVINERPDIVVCDVMMPGIDGLTVLRNLRSNPRTSKIPFVVVSAKAQRSDVKAALDMGADRYITKPFDPQELLDAVEHLLDAGGGKTESTRGRK